MSSILLPITNLSPISRESIRGLKAKIDEENRLTQLKGIVTDIYSRTITTAETTDSTSYQWPIHSNPNHRSWVEEKNYRFIIDNLHIIIQSLKELFQDCSVDHKMMVCSPDGSMHDVLKLDESTRSFIGKQQFQETIVIDWS